MYQEQAQGGIAKIQEKLKTFDEKSHVLLVLYKHQVYMIHNAYALQIHMYALSNVLYRSKRDKKIWRFNEITTLEFKNNDPEFMTVIDQALINEPVAFEYVRVPTPRYSEHEEYYMIQISRDKHVAVD